MLSFNTAGELASAYYPLRDIQWFRDDVLMYTVDGQLRLQAMGDLVRLPPVPLPGPTLRVFRAGGGTWVGHVDHAQNALVGVVKGGVLWPEELAEAWLGDVASTGDVAAIMFPTDADPLQRHVVWYHADTHTMQFHAAATKLLAPPRFDATGRALFWYTGSGWDVVIGAIRLHVAGASPTPAAAMVFQALETWWIAYAATGAIVCHQVADPTQGYRWPLPEGAVVTDLKAVTTDQTYIWWEELDGTVTTLPGIAPGFDMLPLITDLETPMSEATSALDPRPPAMPLPNLSTFNFQSIAFEPDAGDPRPFRRTAKLVRTGFTAARNAMTTDHTHVGLWKPYPVGPENSLVEGNQWLLAWIDGVWVAGCNEWVRPGQTEKDVKAVELYDGTLFYDKNRWPRLNGWKPALGDLIGIFCTTPARLGVRPEDPGQRTQVVFCEVQPNGDLLPVGEEATGPTPVPVPTPEPGPTPTPTPTPTPVPTPDPSVIELLHTVLDNQELLQRQLAEAYEQIAELRREHTALIIQLSKGFTGKGKVAGLPANFTILPTV